VTSYRPALFLFGAVSIAIVAVLLLLRPSEPTPIAAAPSIATATPSVAPPSSMPAPTSQPMASAPPAIPTASGIEAPAPPAVLASGDEPPPLPPQKGVTNEWLLEKTQRIYSVVDDRATRVEKEIADLEKQGKTQEAAEKKVLLKRLRSQMESMRTEMGGYQKNIVSDGGTFDGAVYYDAK
jgi:hypothetical protein